MQLRLESKPEVDREVAKLVMAHQPPLVQFISQGFGPERLQLNILQLMQDAATFSRILEFMGEQIEDLNRQLAEHGRSVDAIIALYPYSLGARLGTNLNLPYLLSNRERPFVDRSNDQGIDINSLKTAVLVNHSRAIGDQEAYIARKLREMQILPAASLTILDHQLVGSDKRILKSGVVALGRLTTQPAIRTARFTLTHQSPSP